MGQPVRRTLSVWVYDQNINNENGVRQRCVHLNQGFTIEQPRYELENKLIGIEKDHTGGRASKTG